MKQFLTGFLSVFKRELRGYFATPVAYVFLGIFLLGLSFYTFLFRNFFASGQASLRIMFEGMPLIFIFFVPAVAMRLWAEERKSNSIMLLFSLPITTAQAVFGKFLAALTVLLIALAATFPTVLTVAWLGNPDPGPVFCGYVASVLLAATYLAIGSFFSALTRNQVIAFILAVVACGIFYMAGHTSILGVVSRLFGHMSEATAAYVAEILESLSFQIHFNSLQRGVLELRDLLFFLIFTGGWLWANLILLEQRRAAR